MFGLEWLNAKCDHKHCLTISMNMKIYKQNESEINIFKENNKYQGMWG